LNNEPCDVPSQTLKQTAHWVASSRFKRCTALRGMQVGVASLKSATKRFSESGLSRFRLAAVVVVGC
jgi:hypothetical protein